MAVIIAVAIVLFVWNRIPVVIVAMATGLSLYATGILTLNQALAGYGDPAVIFIAALFVISAGLDRTGVTAWAGQRLIAGAGEDSRARLLVLISLLVAGLTALISVNGAVAALLPSQLLMPLVFSAHAGSLLALTGTPVNVLVAEAAADAGLRPFGFFDFAIVGIPLLVGTMLIIIFLGERLLPHRGGPSMPADFSRFATTLVEQYGLTKGVYRMRLRATSPLIGQPPSAAEGRLGEGLRLVAVQDGAGTEPLRKPTLAEGDFLIVAGDAEAAGAFAQANHLAFRLEDAAADVR